MIGPASMTYDGTMTAPVSSTALPRAMTAKNRRGLVRHD